MAVKTYRPTTPGRRQASVVTTKELATGPLPKLTKGRASRAGRSRTGTITVRRRGGGAKRLYRTIDFVQTKAVPAIVERLEYDPNRSAWLALLKYQDGDRRYVLAEQQMRPGHPVAVGDDAPVNPGNRLSLSRIPTGSAVFNVELTPGRGGQIVRAAGTAATLTAHEGGDSLLKLPSGEIRRVSSVCLATIGVVSNRDHMNVRIGKAGRHRHLGKRPSVRGKAMNPADHPHGGGEGGSPIGLKGPKTPSGLYTLGRKTRRRGKSSRGIVKARP